MTDLEMTTSTALAMGYRVLYDKSIAGTVYLDVEDASGSRKTMLWSPLVSAEQAMALVKRFGLTIDPQEDEPPFTWRVVVALNGDWDNQLFSSGSDLNRAIVECVAKIPRDAAPQGSTERK